MRNATKTDLIERRSHALAEVMLTRRLDIEVRDLALESLDFLGVIHSELDEPMQRQFLHFGIIVRGTDRLLENEVEATEFARGLQKQTNRLKNESTWFMPVILLLFSMQNDEGYFAWMVEPDKESMKLLQRRQPECVAFDKKQLDRMVSRIEKYYARLESSGSSDDSRRLGEQKAKP